MRHDAQVAQALLDRALASPACIAALSPRRLLNLLTAATELRAAPSAAQLELVQQVTLG
jgi:hypothetical protein